MRHLLLLTVLVPAIAHAEVLDKELSFPVVVGSLLLGAAASFGAARHKPWLLLLVLPPVVLFFAAQLLELTDPHIARALQAEAGMAYVIVWWCALPAVAIAAFLGFRARIRGKVAA